MQLNDTAQPSGEAQGAPDSEALLRDSMDFTRLALSAVGGVGVWTFDALTDVFHCDDAVIELYGLDAAHGSAGFPREEFLANVVMDDRESLRKVMSSGLVKAGDLELEYRIDHPDGSTRWVHSRGHTYFDESGRPVRRTGIAIDRTRRRQIEEQLRQSQKVEAIGQLTGGVAHDFNNLLTVIRMSVDVLRRPNLSDAQRTRYIDAISQTADRAARLTGQLLAFARRQALTPKTFDTRDALSAIRGMLGTLSGTHIRLLINLPDEACFVDADPSQFDTAIINMAVNARDAMSGDGVLRISVGRADHVPVGSNRPATAGDFITVSLTDTGSGIREDRVDAIFEPFFTTKDVGQGTGLGLSQVFGFAMQSGGDIRVQSKLGEGSTFTLYLPRAAAPHDEIPETGKPVPVTAGGRRILLVEDNVDIGAFAMMALTEMGYSTVYAPDASAALAELAADPTGFDAVFSDVMMPGMSGIELGKALRRLYPTLPVILTSGYSSVLAQEGSSGFELLKKPYSIEELASTLLRIIGR
jgi:signal transduction histidine kinase